MRHRNQMLQCRVGWQIILQPLVHHLFDSPCHFAQMIEAHHTPRSLEGMEAAANHRQRFLVSRVVARHILIGLNIGENLYGLFQIHFQQLSIDCLVAHRCRARYGFCLRALTHQFGYGSHQLLTGCSTIPLQHIQRSGTLSTKIAVSNQIGILLQRLQRGTQLLLYSGIFRIVAQRLQQLLSLLLLLIHFGFNSYLFNGFFDKFFFYITTQFAQNRIDNVVLVGLVEMHLLDVETQCRQCFGNLLQIRTVNFDAAVFVMTHRILSQQQQFCRFAQLNHGQRAKNLAEIIGQARQFVAFAVVAEESVQHLLDVLQIDLHFVHQLRLQHFFLCVAAELIQLRQIRQILSIQRRIGQRGQALGHSIQLQR